MLTYQGYSIQIKAQPLSHLIKEAAGVLGTTLKLATTKHAQTIGLLERSHASSKQALEIETGKRRSLCHKYVSFALLIYNTFYHTNTGCEPRRVFMDVFVTLSWI